jgi:hypothetical protein
MSIEKPMIPIEDVNPFRSFESTKNAKALQVINDVAASTTYTYHQDRCRWSGDASQHAASTGPHGVAGESPGW